MYYLRRSILPGIVLVPHYSRFGINSILLIAVNIFNSLFSCTLLTSPLHQHLFTVCPVLLSLKIVAAKVVPANLSIFYLF